MSNPVKTLHIVDGFNILFRAFYAVPSLTRSDNMPVGALYGFVSSLTKLMELETPEYFMVAMDSPGDGVRHDLYPDYKKNRGDAPEEFKVQARVIADVMDTLSIAHVGVPSFEADDVIAAYTRKALQEGYNVVIVSSDKDLAQLVEERVVLLNPGTFVKMDTAGVVDKFGVVPSMILEYLMLVGDSSDNVPGVRGVGPKTAAKLLKQYNNIDGIYAHIDDLKPAAKKSFEDFKSFRATSYDLVRLRHDVAVPAPLEDFLWQGAGADDLEKLVRTYEFFSLQGRMSFLQKHDKNLVEYAQKTFDDEGLEVFLESVHLCGYVNFVKTDAGFVCASGEGAVFAMEDIPEPLRDLMQREDVRCVFWGARGVTDVVRCGHHDDVQILAFLAYGITRLDDLWRHEAFQYVVRDVHEADRLLSLCVNLSRMADACLLVLSQHRLVAWYKEVELPLLNVLWSMERHGMLLDQRVLENAEQDFKKELASEETKVLALAGKTFNLASSQQLARILYDELKILPPSRNQSTDASVLEGVKGEPIVASILRWRMFHKLLSTYVIPLQKKTQNGVIHTHFSSVETLSGRLASFNPNVQNIPIRTPEGALMRKAFVARSGCTLVVCDYSQIELRLLAHYAGKGKLQEAFRQGKDIHRATASLVFDVAEEHVTKNQRSQAKVINFGLVYGMGASALAQRLSLERSQAQELLERCLGQYPEIAAYTKLMQDEAQQCGYVKTVCARPCYLPLIASINTREKNHALRQAINVPLQASNADIMKLLLVQLTPVLQRFDHTHLVLQVHDEVVIETPEGCAEKVQKDVRTLMENIVALDVDLVVDARISPSWAESDGED